MRGIYGLRGDKKSPHRKGRRRCKLSKGVLVVRTEDVRHNCKTQWMHMLQKNMENEKQKASVQLCGSQCRLSAESQNSKLIRTQLLSTRSKDKPIGPQVNK